MNAQIVVPIPSLRALLADLAASADLVDINTAARTFAPAEAAERTEFAAGIRHAVEAIRVDLLGEGGSD